MHWYWLCTRAAPTLQETRENKLVLRELVSRWNRPVYEKEMHYRAARTMPDETEAMEVPSRGGSSAGRRRGGGGVSWNTPQRQMATKDEAVGNILNERAR